MHESVLEYVSQVLTRDEAAGKLVIETGSLNVNGSARPFAESLGASYVGTDMREGEGVDVVADAAELPARFPAGADVVISTSMLEHAVDWQSAVTGMVAVLRPGGVLILTTVSPGYGRHDYPSDYWRFPVPVMGDILEAAGLTVEDLRPDPMVQGVFVKARKPEEWDWPPGVTHAWDALGDLSL